MEAEKHMQNKKTKKSEGRSEMRADEGVNGDAGKRGWKKNISIKKKCFTSE